MAVPSEKKQNKESDPLVEIEMLTDRALRETDKATADRHELTARFLHEIDMEITEAKRMLGLVGDDWKHGEQSLPYEQFRHALDRAITARTKDRRAELLRDWKDRLLLAEKRIDLLKELLALRSPPASDSDGLRD